MEHLPHTPAPTSPLEKIRECGAYERLSLPSGQTLLVLPSCDLPLPVLSPENWTKEEQHGHRRDVRWIKAFRNTRRRIEDTILIKSPERKFSAQG